MTCSSSPMPQAAREITINRLRTALGTDRHRSAMTPQGVTYMKGIAVVALLLTAAGFYVWTRPGAVREAERPVLPALKDETAVAGRVYCGGAPYLSSVLRAQAAIKSDLPNG